MRASSLASVCYCYGTFFSGRSALPLPAPSRFFMRVVEIIEVPRVKQSAVKCTFVSADLIEQGAMAAGHFALGDFTMFVVCGLFRCCWFGFLDDWSATYRCYWEIWLVGGPSQWSSQVSHVIVLCFPFGAVLRERSPSFDLFL